MRVSSLSSTALRHIGNDQLAYSSKCQDVLDQRHGVSLLQALLIHSSDSVAAAGRILRLQYNVTMK